MYVTNTSKYTKDMSAQNQKLISDIDTFKYDNIQLLADMFIFATHLDRYVIRLDKFSRGSHS